MSGSAPDRKALEELWRQRTKDAALRLDFARSYVKELQRDFPAGALPSADGHYLHERALHAENFALKEYQRVLRIFTDLRCMASSLTKLIGHGLRVRMMGIDPLQANPIVPLERMDDY